MRVAGHAAVEDEVSSSGRVKLLIADPDPLARRAVSEAIAAHRDVVVVAQAATTTDAIAALLEYEPDVVLLDTELPPGGGLTATAQLLATRPSAGVVLFAVQEDEELGLSGLQAGAAGFLSKGIDLGALTRALAAVPRGEAAVSRHLALEAIVRMRVAVAQMRDMRPVSGPLTDRQWQVLDLMAEGRTPLEIAELLGVSPHTVRRHMRRLQERLEAPTAKEALRAAERLRAGVGTSRQGSRGL